MYGYLTLNSMKLLHKISAVVSALTLVFGVVGPTVVLAATTPSLGMAATFGILGSTYTNTVGGTTVTGDVGYTTGPAVAPTVSGTTHIADGTYNTAGTDQGSALSSLASQPCTFTFAPGAIDLATDTTHGPIGTYTPGVYCTSGAASIGTGGMILSGSGTYIFRISGALTSVANSAVTLTNGATACDVFWTPTAATTLGANSTFVGTDVDASGITMGSTVAWTGRALAFGGTISTTGDTMTVPTCAILATPTPTPIPTPITTPTPTPVLIFTPTPAPTLIFTPTPTPVLPAAGIGPDNGTGASWGMVASVGIFVILSAFFVARKKQLI